jgi:hypothetical protein
VIPPLVAIVAACRYLERRFEWDEPLDIETIDECHRDARRLARQSEDEPAALFFAFSRPPALLADAYTVIPLVLCRNHAAALGYEIMATRFALVDLKHEISANLHTFEDVRAWFAARLTRTAG